MQVQANDNVIIELEVKGRASGRPHQLRRTFPVAELDMKPAKAAVAPVFDAAGYTRGITSNDPLQREAAQRIHADYLRQVADFQAAQGQGGGTPADRLATAIVDWAIRTSPDGQRFSRNPNDDAFVLTEREVNISRGVVAGVVYWRCTAVGTWGK